MPDRYIRSIDGKRGSFLLICGFFWTLLGITYVAYTTPGREAGFAWVPFDLGPRELGVLWIVGGIAVMLLSLRSRTNPESEPIAFGLLAIPPAIWVTIFIGSALISGNGNGWTTAISYGAYLAMVLYVSSWPNPPEVRQ